MPLIQFLIGGVQKGGTSALTRYLAAHPGVRFPRDKEGHVFDDPRFDDDWPAERIDRQFDPNPAAAASGLLHGDATPLNVFHPLMVQRIARYNPSIKWIILLRDPVDRAISHYYMVRSRGHEPLPLWLALLAERWRLRGGGSDLRFRSPLRSHSYIARGRYVRQLDVLHAHFPAEQIRLLRSQDLWERPESCVAPLLAWLGLPCLVEPQAFEHDFVGDYDHRRHRLVRWVLRLLFRSELAELQRRYGIDLRERNGALPGRPGTQDTPQQGNQILGIGTTRRR